MMRIERIDHVQLGMPPGEEEEARGFYVGVLGMTEIAKPPVLTARGGAWFQAGPVQLHLGVEQDFRPAKIAHVALAISGGQHLRKNLMAAGFPVRDDQSIDGVQRFFTDDAFGNRIEFIEVK